jgi:hypothetical protein
MFGQEGKEEYTTEVHLPPSNYLNIPMKIRERHLTKECYRMGYEAHSTGTHFQALLESENDNILVRIPFKHWRVGRMYERKLNDWSLYLERWADNFESIGTVVENNTEKRVIEMEILILDDSMLEEKTHE